MVQKKKQPPPAPARFVRAIDKIMSAAAEYDNPLPVTWELCRFDEGGSADIQVHLTLDEFNTLNQHLAQLRTPKPAAPEAKRPEISAVGLLAGLTKLQIEDLNTCAKIFRVERGIVTPAENFIRNLVHLYEWGMLTPERARKELEGEEGFERDFEEAIEAARHIATQYPDQFKAEGKAAA